MVTMLRNQNVSGILLKVSKFILAMSLAAPAVSVAQNMTVYSNALVNGWQNWGWATLNYTNTSPVYAGCTYSISVTIPTNGYEGIQIYHAEMSDSNYASISFWLNGGASGGQDLQMYAILQVGTNLNVAQSSRYALSTPQSNTWTQYTVPLSNLGVANVTNFTGFVIQDSANKAEPAFYLDDIQLNSSAAPTLTQLTVNASQPIRTADARWFGLNATIWDDDFDTPQTITFLTNMGTQALRFPGGSDSDDYHWLYNRQDQDDWTWETSLASYIQVITNLGAETMITLNYGTGTSNEAAAWVAYVNAATTNTLALGTDQYGTNWQTAGYWASLRAAAPLGTDDGKNFLRIKRTAPLGFKYWEIGNEVYGASWETDSNNVPHDPYTYAVRSQGYISLIKAVDPTVKIGVVVENGEDSYVNNHNHLVTNPVTGQTHYGWTPVLLATLKSQGVTPDFAIFHNYPQNPGGESDAGLLGSTTGWAGYAADLRGQITDYMGSNGTNIELVCTENNSVSSAPGKQSVSLVNGLYKVDSLAQLMQTEFNGLFWWALRNGAETNGNMSSSLYGWREYGDYGVVSNGYSTLYPTYFTTELMKDFVQTGDTVITAASGYSLLPAYAVRRQNGSLTVLTINKDPINTLNGQVSVAGFTPASNAVVYSYGIPQDTAAENGTGSTNVAQTNISFTGTNISYAFPPYSATVMALSPAPVTASAGGPQTICAGGSTPIGGSPTATNGVSPYTYSWSPATALSSTTVANPTASPTSTTTYTVTVTDSQMSTAQSSMTVTVHALPTVSVNSATVCAGSLATLTATTGAGSPSYLWSPGGATTASITVSPASTTTYTVTVTDGTTGCANSGSGTVTVHALPAVSVNSATVCAGSSATLTATTGASSPSYLWSPGGATTGSITVSPASTTTYTVTVTDGTTGCAKSVSGTVTVHALPTVSVNSATVCAGGSATLTATTGASSPSYLWSPGGATTGSITVSPASTTTYTVTVTDGATGCANSGSGAVTVHSLPTITLGTSPVLTYYSSTNANLPYTATSGSPDGYSIAYGSTAQAAGFTNVALTSLPASPIRLAVPIAAGTNTYTGTLTLNNSSTGCSSTNYAFAVTVTPLPLVLTGTRAYDGTATAAAGILSVVNAAGSDDVSLASGSAILAGTSVGPEAITLPGSLALGGLTAGNYTLTGVSGIVTITNPSIPFLISSSSLDITGTNFVVCWQSVPGVVYNVLTNTSMAPPQSWAVAGGPITATNTTTCFTLPGGIVGNTNVNVVIQQ